MKKIYNTPVMEIKMFESAQNVMIQVGPDDSAIIDNDRFSEIIYEE